MTTRFMQLGLATVVLVAVAVAVALVVGPGAAFATTSDVGRDLGDEVRRWSTTLLLGVAGLVAIPVLVKRDVNGGLVLALLVVIVGGFAFAPGAVKQVITSLWQAIAAEPMPERELQIRSFRVVFDLERRIHRVDRWRLPFPYGLPLRSLAYAVVALVVLAAAARVPGINTMMMALPAPARLVLVPVAMSYAPTRVHVDGRNAHAAAGAWLAHARDRTGFTYGVPATDLVTSNAWGR